MDSPPRAGRSPVTAMSPMMPSTETKPPRVPGLPRSASRDSLSDDNFESFGTNSHQMVGSLGFRSPGRAGRATYLSDDSPSDEESDHHHHQIVARAVHPDDPAEYSYILSGEGGEESKSADGIGYPSEPTASATAVERSSTSAAAEKRGKRRSRRSKKSQADGQFHHLAEVAAAAQAGGKGHVGVTPSSAGPPGPAQQPPPAPPGDIPASQAVVPSTSHRPTSLSDVVDRLHDAAGHRSRALQYAAHDLHDRHMSGLRGGKAQRREAMAARASAAALQEALARARQRASMEREARKKASTEASSQREKSEALRKAALALRSRAKRAEKYLKRLEHSTGKGESDRAHLVEQMRRAQATAEDLRARLAVAEEAGRATSSQRDEAMREAAAQRRAADVARHQLEDARRSAEESDRRWPERRAELSREYDRRTEEAVRAALARQEEQVRSLREQLAESKAAREREVSAVRLAAQREGVDAEAKVTDADRRVAAAEDRSESTLQRCRQLEEQLMRAKEEEKQHSAELLQAAERRSAVLEQAAETLREQVRQMQARLDEQAGTHSKALQQADQRIADAATARRDAEATAAKSADAVTATERQRGAEAERARGLQYRLEQAYRDLEDAAYQIEEQHAETQRLTAEKHKSATAAAVASTKLQEAHSLLDFQKKVAEQLQGQVDSLREEATAARQEALDARGTADPVTEQRLSTARREVDELNKACDALKADNGDLDRRCQALQTDLRAAYTAHREARDAATDLEDRIEDTKQEAARVTRKGEAYMAQLLALREEVERLRRQEMSRPDTPPRPRANDSAVASPAVVRPASARDPAALPPAVVPTVPAPLSTTASVVARVASAYYSPTKAVAVAAPVKPPAKRRTMGSSLQATSAGVRGEDISASGPAAGAAAEVSEPQRAAESGPGSSSTEADLAAARQDLMNARARVSEADEAVYHLRSQLAATKSENLDAEAALQQARYEHARVRAQLEVDLEQAAEKMGQLYEELATQSDSAADLRGDLNASVRQAGELKSKLAKAEEELARAVAESKRNGEELAEALSKLSEAESTLSQQGETTTYLVDATTKALLGLGLSPPDIHDTRTSEVSARAEYLARLLEGKSVAALARQRFHTQRITATIARQQPYIGLLRANILPHVQLRTILHESDGGSPVESGAGGPIYERPAGPTNTGSRQSSLVHDSASAGSSGGIFGATAVRSPESRSGEVAPPSPAGSTNSWDDESPVKKKRDPSSGGRVQARLLPAERHAGTRMGASPLSSRKNLPVVLTREDSMQLSSDDESDLDESRDRSTSTPASGLIGAPSTTLGRTSRNAPPTRPAVQGRALRDQPTTSHARLTDVTELDAVQREGAPPDDGGVQTLGQRVRETLSDGSSDWDDEENEDLTILRKSGSSSLVGRAGRKGTERRVTMYAPISPTAAVATERVAQAQSDLDSIAASQPSGSIAVSASDASSPSPPELEQRLLTGDSSSSSAAPANTQQADGGPVSGQARRSAIAASPPSRLEPVMQLTEDSSHPARRRDSHREQHGSGKRSGRRRGSSSDDLDDSGSSDGTPGSEYSSGETGKQHPAPEVRSRTSSTWSDRRRVTSPTFPFKEETEHRSREAATHGSGSLEGFVADPSDGEEPEPSGAEQMTLEPVFSPTYSPSRTRIPERTEAPAGSNRASTGWYYSAFGRSAVTSEKQTAMESVPEENTAPREYPKPTVWSVEQVEREATGSNAPGAAAPSPFGSPAGNSGSTESMSEDTGGRIAAASAASTPRPAHSGPLREAPRLAAAKAEGAMPESIGRVSPGGPEADRLRKARRLSRSLSEWQQEVYQLPSRQIEQLRRCKLINDAVAVLAGTLCLLQNEPPSWRNAYQLLGRVGIREALVDIHPDEIPDKPRGIIAKLLATKNVRAYVQDPVQCDPNTKPAEFVLISWSIALLDAASWIADEPANLHAWRELEVDPAAGRSDGTAAGGASSRGDAIVGAGAGSDGGGSRLAVRDITAPPSQASSDGGAQPSWSGSAHAEYHNKRHRRVVMAPQEPPSSEPKTVIRAGGVEVVQEPLEVASPKAAGGGGGSGERGASPSAGSSRGSPRYRRPDSGAGAGTRSPKKASRPAVQRLPAADAMREFQQGYLVRKYDARGWGTFFGNSVKARLLWLDRSPAVTRVCWAKPDASIAHIADDIAKQRYVLKNSGGRGFSKPMEPDTAVKQSHVAKVTVGRVTDLLKAQAPESDEKFCFSIHTRERSFDFRAPTQAQRDHIVSCISTVVECPVERD